MIWSIEKDEDWVILKINLDDVILSSTDLEWLIKTPGAFELELFNEDGDLVCQLYFESQEESE
jgi:hypothetical protein